MSCDTETRLMIAAGKPLGLTRRAVATHAVGSGGFRGCLKVVAPEARVPAIAPETRG